MTLWRKLSGLVEVLEFVKGKELGGDPTQFDEKNLVIDYGEPYVEKDVVAFTDNTGLACLVFDSWDYSEFTPGEPARVAYYALTH